jgi:hypothetical protein
MPRRALGSVAIIGIAAVRLRAGARPPVFGIPRSIVRIRNQRRAGQSDNHGHPIKNRKALGDARALIDELDGADIPPRNATLATS